MGHQVAPPFPEASVWEMMGALINQGCALFEMSPFSSAAEISVVKKLAAKLGWTEGFGGFGTHGGTLANMTALLTARNLKFPGVWQEGGSAIKDAVVLVSGDSHYSISRALGVMGLGTNQLIKVPLDSRRRVRGKALQSAITDLRASGKQPFAVVANSGSTSSGAFDCLNELADVSEKESLWLHVDGAHGASVLFSEKHRSLVEGIHRADSVVWDAHKLLWMPALTTFLLYRDGEHCFQTFQQDAPYLFDPAARGMAEFDGGTRTFECTKRSLALPLWGMWAQYGDQIFADAVDVTFSLCQRLYQKVVEAPDFSPVHEPQGNIFCFRFEPSERVWETETARSECQQRLRRLVVESGNYYMTSTRIDGEMVLRVTIMNPLTGDVELDGLLDEVRRVAGVAV